MSFSLAAGLLVGLGLGGTTWSVIYGAVGRAFTPEKHANVFAIVGAAGSFGQFTLVPLGQGLIGGLGWAPALLIFAVIISLIVPLAAGGAETGRRSLHAGSDQSTGEALRQAFRHKGFWLLTLGFFACGFQLLFIAAQPPHRRTAGYGCRCPGASQVMRRKSLVRIVVALALVFGTGWAFRGYLEPAAVVDFANRLNFCG